MQDDRERPAVRARESAPPTREDRTGARDEAQILSLSDSATKSQTEAAAELRAAKAGPRDAREGSNAAGGSGGH